MLEAEANRQGLLTYSAWGFRLLCVAELLLKVEKLQQSEREVKIKAVHTTHSLHHIPLLFLPSQKYIAQRNENLQSLSIHLCYKLLLGFGYVF